MNVAIKVTTTSTTLGNPALTTYEQIARADSHSNAVHFLVTDAPDDMPRSAVYTQFCRIAPCKQYTKGHGEIGSPEREQYGTIYPWAEIAGKPQGAMIF
jgi:predicted DNA-binding ribbon-helix-helix protein